MKVFMEMMQAQTSDQEHLERQERLFKVKTSETYFEKFYIDCYHFCQ